MIAARASLARGIATARQARLQSLRVARTNLKPALRRGYASGGHEHAAPSSDLPWLAGAIAVTVPSVYYLWPTPHEGGHGDHGDHEDHAEEHEDKSESKDETEDKEDEGGDDSKVADDAQEKDSQKEKSEGREEDKSEDNDDDDKGDAKHEKEDDKSAAKSGSESEQTSNKKVDGVQFKGKTSAGDDNNEQTDTRKREPDSKGGFKKRIDSDYQKDLGAGERKDEDGKPSGKSATEPSGNAGAIDTKQSGLSTTPTRHSTQIDEDPDKSKKPSGAPETAKSQTTVHPETGKKK